ncbi:hypothetical protein D3C84_587640 [compost metagenome]
MGGGTHFIGGGGHLVDFAELDLHAVTGLAGDFRRLVGGGPGLAYALLDLRDGRLQLVEEAVEPADQGTQFVFFTVLQALSQVAVATGNGLEHGSHLVDRPRHAGGGQPHQQQSDQPGAGSDQQCLERAAGLRRIEDALQFYRIGQQYLLGQVDDHAPGPGAGDRRNRVHGTYHLALLEHLCSAVVQRLLQRLGRIAQHLGQVLADCAGVVAVGGEQAGAGGDQHMPGTASQFALGSGGGGLQRIQGQVDTHYCKHFAVDDQWHGDGRHQYLLVVDLVLVGFEQAGPGVVPGTGVPGVVGRTAEVEVGLVQVLLDDQGVDSCPTDTAPVSGKATCVVTAARGIVDELAVLAVERVGFERQPDAQHAGVALEGGFQCQVDFFTQGAWVHRAGLAHGAQVAHLVRQRGDQQQVFAEGLLHGHCLFGGLGL